MWRVSDTNAHIACQFATFRSPFALESAPAGQVVPVVLNDSAITLATPRSIVLICSRCPAVCGMDDALSFAFPLTDCVAGLIELFRRQHTDLVSPGIPFAFQFRELFPMRLGQIL
jgi:hypothetical protein